jgi:hypothetical protein
MTPLGSGQEARRQTRYAEGEPTDWPTALAIPGPEQDHALRALHALMVKAARHQVWRMRDMLPTTDARSREDLANGAADEALTVLLTKLDTFEGRSRFTTWAYKFAILQAATEVRRQAWAHREVSLEDADLWSDAAPGPAQHAEAVEERQQHEPQPHQGWVHIVAFGYPLAHARDHPVLFASVQPLGHLYTSHRGRLVIALSTR